MQFRYIFFALCLGVFSGSCTSDDQESDRARTVRLLTNNNSKIWYLDQKLIDEQIIDFTLCDSSYQLTIQSDFTWTEQHPNANCGGIDTGNWDLNDENNVLITYYLPFLSSDIIERKFEIEELSEDLFSYQYVDKNSLIKINLTVKK